MSSLDFNLALSQDDSVSVAASALDRMGRARVTSARMRTYDQHQNQVQQRSIRSNNQMRRNIRDGLVIVGGAVGVAALLHNMRRGD